MNKVEAKIVGFEMSDITLEDSYMWADFIKYSLIFREFNLGYPTENPLTGVETYIEWRLFDSPNPFLQHIRFYSKVRFEFAKAQPSLDPEDLTNLYTTHAEQTNDIIQEMRNNSQLSIDINIPVFDNEVEFLSYRIFETHFKNFDND